MSKTRRAAVVALATALSWTACSSNSRNTAAPTASSSGTAPSAKPTISPVVFTSPATNELMIVPTAASPGAVVRFFGTKTGDGLPATLSEILGQDTLAT